MPTENSAVVKIMTKKDKDYNTLSDKYVKLGEKHKTLMEVHLKTLKALDNCKGDYAEQRREFLKDLKITYQDIEIDLDDGNDPKLACEYIEILREKWGGKK